MQYTLRFKIIVFKHILTFYFLLFLPVVTAAETIPTEVVRPSWASDFGYDEYGTFARFRVNSEVQTMRWIAPSNYLMGSESNDETATPIHQVDLSGFWMGDSEVTQGLWQSAMGSNPSKFIGDLTRPVDSITWNDCLGFFQRLNVIVPGIGAVFPTEAQWEYVCRAGPAGERLDVLDKVAWYSLNSDSKTHPVKSKERNALGVFDMHGNVSEWCSDFWINSYGAWTAQRDPVGPPTGSARVFRGSNWTNPRFACYPDIRSHFSPGSAKFSYMGVRLVIAGPSKP